MSICLLDTLERHEEASVSSPKPNSVILSPFNPSLHS
jgi:hypothetical protein